jgi:L-threonylcarbamoyladenylate synthase
MELSEALRAGLPVLLPTDTVYGLAASAAREEFAANLYAVKGRESSQPTALLAGNVAVLLDAVPELDRTIVETLLPGPFTLVLRNPARRFPWLTGETPEAIGVRVPELPKEARQALEAVGCVAATSANDPGGPDPVRLDDVPARIRAAAAAELDVGPLPGTPSTVIDFTGPEARVLREGAAPGGDAIARVRAALPT